MKAVFITGAAQGIGLATAKLFANYGWFVGLYDINTSAINDLLDKEQAFDNACGGYCDVTDADSIKASLDDFSQHSNNRLDLLINNAGVLSSGPFEDIAANQNNQMIDVNIKGLTNVALQGFPLLKSTAEKYGNSTLLNLCSASSITAIPELTVYSASKYYVNGITEGLHNEWKKYRIRVTSVKPPIVDTALGRTNSESIQKNFGVEFLPEEVATHIYRAAHGSKVAYPLGFKTRLWALVNRLAPDSVRCWLLRQMMR